MRHAVLLACAACAASAVAARAQAPAPVRAEVPVREVVLSNGTRRYAVPIRVGAAELDAGLDTGSSGLRLVPGAVSDADATPTGRGDSYSFGAGAKLDGVVGRATVSVGALSGATTLQLVRKVGCTAAKPRCEAGSIPVAQYGVQGDGLPGEGFKAILGVNMASAEIPGLFAGIGARRWIVELPRPGEGAPGRIVLNPTDAETQGFVALPVVERYADRPGGLHDAVAGCLQNQATRARVCGAVLLDSGAPGLRLRAPDAPSRPWADGAPALLLLADASGQVRVSEALAIGRRNQATGMSTQSTSDPPSPAIFAGLTPYFAYAVLYDPGRGTVAFRPRAVSADGPQPVPLAP